MANVATWFDNRTLLACQSFTTALFGVGLLGMHLSYRKIPGVRTMAAAFLLGCPASILVAMHGVIPNIFSMAVGNAAIYLSYLLMYRGLAQYFRVRASLTFAYILFAAASCTHLFFTIGYESLMARILVASITLTTLRILIVVILVRNAGGSLHRKLFAGCVTVFTLVGMLRTPLTLIHGAPHDFMQQNTVQTYMLLMGLAFLAIDGAFYITLIGLEIARNLKQTSQIDSLTGVFNRRGIEEKLRDELARSARGGTILSAMLIDLDHFKAINDTHGHRAGDNALKQVAYAISSTLRPYDHLGRFGGDEFLLLLPEADRFDSRAVATRIAASIDHPTLSIGIAQCDPGESAASLLARADQALYQAKADGRNCIRLQATDSLAPDPLVAGSMNVV